MFNLRRHPLAVFFSSGWVGGCCGSRAISGGKLSRSNTEAVSSGQALVIEIVVATGFSIFAVLFKRNL